MMVTLLPSHKLSKAIGHAMLLPVLLVLATSTAACPIPVFQYALEHWESDPYDLVVHHHGELTEAQQAVVEKLRALEQGEDGKANITLMLRDHAPLEHPPQPAAELPYIEVRYPMISGIRGTLMTQPLTAEAVESLLRSPVRQKLAEYLVQRDAAVWVLLESGDRDEDEKALRTLQRELPRMAQTLKVPDPREEWGIDLGDIHTEINFNILRVSRNDPREQAFMTMLLGVERDLHDYADKPMVFPIYGRGLVMYALIGDGINPRTINTVGEFLTGPCSCQIKSGNPGVDLLIALNWEEKVEKKTDVGIAAPAGADGFVDRMKQAEDRLRDDDDDE